MVRMASEDIGPRRNLARSPSRSPPKDAFDFLGRAPKGHLALGASRRVSFLSRQNPTRSTPDTSEVLRRRAQNRSRSRPATPAQTRPLGLMKNVGYGKGYQYAHEYEEKVHWHAMPPRQSSRPQLLPSPPTKASSSASASASTKSVK